jgi:hypothetical protein
MLEYLALGWLMLWKLHIVGNLLAESVTTNSGRHDNTREILTLLILDDDPALPPNNLSVSGCIIYECLGHQSHYPPCAEDVYASHSSAL